MGDYARAEPLLREAREIRKKALGEAHPHYADSLDNLAWLYVSTGEYARAEPLLRQALAVMSTFSSGTAAALGERQRLRLLAQARSTLDGYLSVATDGLAEPADLYGHVLGWKGAADAQQADDRLARDRPELKPTLDQLAAVRTRLVRLAFAPPAGNGRDAWRRQLGELRSQKEDLEADLAARSAAFRKERQDRRPWPGELATTLPEGAALVDLFEYGHF
jgi:tetratricopeptide (TPR) repeat protein